MTLDHPHQIYAMSQLPDRIEKVAAAFRHDDPLSGLRRLQQLVLAQNDGIAFVPPGALSV